MANEPSKETIKVGDYATIYGDVFTGGKHIYYNVQRPPIGTPFQAPPLPAHFVPRPEVTDAIKTRLLADKTSTPGILVVSAIHGLGGIGKSTLAAALAYDPEVQARFNDGILWATLGQQPELLSLLSGWIQTLGDYDFHPTTLEAASTHLRTLLQDKATLLVVDDVWEPEHALPFRVGGSQGQVLITTRRVDVAEEVGADLHQMDAMTPEQSLNLMAARLGHPLVETEQAEALALAKEVGYLPLALELAATRVVRGTTWAALRGALKAEIARLEELEGPRRRRGERPRLEASFNLSLNALRAEDEVAWQAFVWLGVLPEDVRIAAPMAATLWEMNEAEASEMLELLWGDALLLPAPLLLIGVRQWPAYRLHDLLHDVARRLLTTSPPHGLGLDLPTTHAALLERYKKRTQNGLWHTLRDDGYIYTHLTWHMEQAARFETIFALVAKDDKWAKTRYYHEGSYASYLVDLERAWRWAESDTGWNVAHQIRCALIESSIRSLVRNMSPELLRLLVETRVWSPALALTNLLQIPEDRERAVALEEIAPLIPAALAEKVLAVALAIGHEFWQVYALSKVAEYLPDELVRDALAAARAIKDEAGKAKALCSLADKLPRDQQIDVVREALSAAQAITDEWEKAEVLGKLAKQLPKGLKDEAWATAQALMDDKARAHVLRELAVHPIIEARICDALTAARAIKDEVRRAYALTKLVEYLSEDKRMAVVTEALTTVQAITNERLRDDVLSRIVDYLPKEFKEEAWAATQAIADERMRAITLSKVAAVLPEELLKDALAAARAIKDEPGKARVLSSLTMRLPEEEQIAVMKEALTTAQAITDERGQDIALSWVVEYLPDDLKSYALATAQAIKDVEKRIAALNSLAEHLTETERTSVVKEALGATQTIMDEWERAETLTKLARYLPVELIRDEVWVAVQAITDNRAWVKALDRLAALLPEEIILDALATARLIKDDVWRAYALSSLLEHLPETQRAVVLTEALAAARAIRDDDAEVSIGRRSALLIIGKRERAHALSWLLEYLPEDQQAAVLTEALATARAITNESWRVETLKEVLAYVPESQQATVVTEIWAEIQAMTDERSQGYALKRLAALLPEELLMDILAVVQTIKDQEGKAEALSGLLARLSEEQRVEVVTETLVIAQAIADEWKRAEILSSLAAYLPEDLREKAWSTALAIKNVGRRAKALSSLATHLPEEQQALAMAEVLTAVRLVKDEQERAYGLSELIDYVPDDQWPELLQTIAENILDGDQETQFSRLVSIWQASNFSKLAEQPPRWISTLRSFGYQDRRNVLRNLSALSPLIAHLGGPIAISKTVVAIRDVSMWWP